MVAVMEEEDDFASDFRLQPSGGHDFRVEESLRKKSARLLAETNHRRHGLRHAAHRAGRVVSENCVLQGQAKEQHRPAADHVVPKITDVERGEEHKHEQLGNDGGEKHGRAADLAQEKCDEKEAENTAVEN